MTVILDNIGQQVSALVVLINTNNNNDNNTFGNKSEEYMYIYRERENIANSLIGNYSTNLHMRINPLMTKY